MVRPPDAPNLEIDQATERAVMAAVRAAEAEERQKTQQAIFAILGHVAAGAAEGYAESKDGRRSATSSPTAPRTKAITCRPSLT